MYAGRAGDQLAAAVLTDDFFSVAPELPVAAGAELDDSLPDEPLAGESELFAAPSDDPEPLAGASLPAVTVLEPFRLSVR